MAVASIIRVTMVKPGVSLLSSLGFVNLVSFYTRSHVVVCLILVSHTKIFNVYERGHSVTSDQLNSLRNFTAYHQNNFQTHYGSIRTEELNMSKDRAALLVHRFSRFCVRS